MIESAHPPHGAQREALLACYDAALPQVYGYLVRRTGTSATAEDLTSETFLAAAAAVRIGHVGEVTIAWLIGIARHKLIDHWRRREREQRVLAAVSEPHRTDDAWDTTIDALTAERVLSTMSGNHRTVLTLRYLDDLPVRQISALLGRSEGATEALLMRAKAAFRMAYEESR